MLGKLIKYDLMFGAKKYAIMAVLTAALLVVAAVAASFDSELIMGLAIFFAIVATVTLSVMYIVISVRHLATQLGSKESYLGYSIPTSAHTLLSSKLISIFIWGIVTTLLIVFFWMVGIGGIALAESGMSLGDMWSEMIRGMQQAGLGSDFIDTIIFMVVLMGVSSSIMMICLLGFSVAVSNIPFLKERGIGTVTGVVGYFAIYFAINYAMGKIGELFIDSYNGMNYDFYNFSDIAPALNSVTIYYSIASIVIAAGLYFLSVYILDKHRFIE